MATLSDQSKVKTLSALARHETATLPACPLHHCRSLLGAMAWLVLLPLFWCLRWAAGNSGFEDERLLTPPSTSLFRGLPAPTNLKKWLWALHQARAGNQVLLSRVMNSNILDDLIQYDPEFRWIHKMSTAVMGTREKWNLSTTANESRTPIVMFGYYRFRGGDIAGGVVEELRTLEPHSLGRQFKIPRRIVALGMPNENWGWASTYFLNRTVPWKLSMGGGGKSPSDLGFAYPQDVLRGLLDDPNLVMLVVNQHHNISHEKIISVPLGVKNGRAVHQAALKFIKVHAGRAHGRKSTLLLSATSDYAFRRRIKSCVARAMGDRAIDSSRSPLEPAEFFDSIIRAYTVLCPPGLGYDTYRTWEALALGAVPVLERGFGLDRTFFRLPVLLVDDFSDLRPLLLEQAYVQALYLSDEWDYRRMTKTHWEALVQDASRAGNISEMLRKHPLAAEDAEFVRPLVPLGFDCRAVGKRCPNQSCAIDVSNLAGDYNWAWTHDTPGPGDDRPDEASPPPRRLQAADNRLLLLVADSPATMGFVRELLSRRVEEGSDYSAMLFTRGEGHYQGAPPGADVRHCSAPELGTTACVLEALYIASKAHPHKHVLLMVYGDRSAPLLQQGVGISALFDALQRKNKDLLLLPKIHRLDSVSSWHDLQVVFASTGGGRDAFFSCAREVYLSYATRHAFKMLQPRPALLEAIVESQRRLSIGYLGPADVCAFHSGNENAGNIARQAAHSCTPNDTHSPLIRIFCGGGGSEEDRSCSMLGHSHAWKQDILHGQPVADLEQKLGLDRARWSVDLPDAMDAGSLRYRLAERPDEPKKYCFLEPAAPPLARPPQSLIYDRFNSHRTPEVLPRSTASAKPRIVVLTGDRGDWRSIDTYMYESLSKMHYASWHGHKFVFQPSLRFEKYFPRDLFAALGRAGDSENYFRGVMAKPLLILDAMLQHTEAEWVFWLDADAWINVEWLDLPLDSFLEGVPEHKLWVHTNYRSLLTGAFFVRNSAEGRALVRDWLSIAMSGKCSCHGFDQAAIEVLFLLRQHTRNSSSSHSYSTSTPFNFSALERRFGGWGCNGGADWSVDYKFEKVLNRLGFRTRNSGFWSDISSYSRGCANDLVKDFHVVTETRDRPRLQCFHCGSPHELRAGVWDGPLGGGNDRVFAGAVNGYFSNHKANWLFHHTHLNTSTCSRGSNFLQQCNTDRSSLLSLSDGYGLDIESGTFCEVDNASKDEQRARTYMRDYGAAIAAASGYSQSLWDSQYRALGGSESRGNRCAKLSAMQLRAAGNSSCSDEGLLWREKDSDWFLLPVAYCKACKVIDSTLLGAEALDCSGLLM